MGKSIEKKRLCKFSSDIIDDQLEAYIGLVSEPKFICLNCLRVAVCKDNLCKPKKVKKLLAA